jgi:hypothetical protein
MTPIGILYFPALFTPKVNKENPNQGARFSGVLLFDALAVGSTAYTELRQAIRNACVEKFGEAKVNDPAFMRNVRSPLRPASEKTYAGFEDFEDGDIFISAWCKGDEAAPGVVDLQGQQILVPGDVWGGQLARMTVRPFAYDNVGNKGVGFYLEHVQIVKSDMPRRDGKQSAEQAFKNANADDQMKALGITPGASSSAGAPGGSPFPF